MVRYNFEWDPEDTYSTLHMATLQDRATTPETRKLLWRVSVTGKAPVYERSSGR
jgi:hypothetical protein